MCLVSYVNDERMSSVHSCDYQDYSGYSECNGFFFAFSNELSVSTPCWVSTRSLPTVLIGDFDEKYLHGVSCTSLRDSMSRG